MHLLLLVSRAAAIAASVPPAPPGFTYVKNAAVGDSSRCRGAGSFDPAWSVLPGVLCAW